MPPPPKPTERRLHPTEVVSSSFLWNHRHIALRVWRSSSPTQLFDAYGGRRFVPDETGGNITTFDGSVPPRTAHVFHVDGSSFGGDDDEAVNVEVRYVYVVDGDRPAPGLTEPRFAPLFLARSTIAEPAMCPPGRPAGVDTVVDPGPR